MADRIQTDTRTHGTCRSGRVRMLVVAAQGAAMELIRLQDITKTHHLGEVDVPVLRGISLSIARGERPGPTVQELAHDSHGVCPWNRFRSRRFERRAARLRECRAAPRAQPGRASLRRFGKRGRRYRQPRQPRLDRLSGGLLAATCRRWKLAGGSCAVYGENLPATSYIPQPPCEGKKLAIEAMGLAGPPGS